MNDDNALDVLDVPLLFGRFLVLNRILSEADIDAAVRVQKEINANAIFSLIEHGVLSVEDMGRAWRHQRECMVSFRAALEALHILDADGCAAAFELVEAQRMRLGEVLVKQGRITREKLTEALEQHRVHQSKPV